MKILLAILVALAYVQFGILVNSSSIGDLWNQWKKMHEKDYNGTEEGTRYTIWKNNLQLIKKHNNDGSSSFKMGLNDYSDMTFTEMKRTILGYTIPAENIANGTLKKNNRTYTIDFTKPNNKIPESKDWRKCGFVTPVKHQGFSCRSCWAFSATGSLEGQHYRKSGKLISLSEQNLIDCDKTITNKGCQGGRMKDAFTYIKNNKGINTETYYPYIGKEHGKCNFSPDPDHVGATCTGFVPIKPRGDETVLKNAVAIIGPISVAISVLDSLKLYKSGVYDEPACGNNVSHAVLIVGYGTENGKDYWLVKNSYGERYGEKGYIKMRRNYNNMCGIALYASYPTVDGVNYCRKSN